MSSFGDIFKGKTVPTINSKSLCGLSGNKNYHYLWTRFLEDVARSKTVAMINASWRLLEGQHDHEKKQEFDLTCGLASTTRTLYLMTCWFLTINK